MHDGTGWTLDVLILGTGMGAGTSSGVDLGGATQQFVSFQPAVEIKQ